MSDPCEWCDESPIRTTVVLTAEAVAWSSWGTVGAAVRVCNRCAEEIRTGKFGQLPATGATLA